MNLKEFLNQHLRTEVVSLPPDPRLGKLARAFAGHKFRFRYLPKLIQIEVKEEFEKGLKMTPEEELALFQALDREKFKQATMADFALINQYGKKTQSSGLIVALYAEAIVKPKMTRDAVSTFLRSLTPPEYDDFILRTYKYVEVVPEVVADIKKSSAPKTPSRTSEESTSGTGDACRST